MEAREGIVDSQGLICKWGSTEAANWAPNQRLTLRPFRGPVHCARCAFCPAIYDTYLPICRLESQIGQTTEKVLLEG